MFVQDQMWNSCCFRERNMGELSQWGNITWFWVQTLPMCIIDPCCKTLMAHLFSSSRPLDNLIFQQKTMQILLNMYNLRILLVIMYCNCLFILLFMLFIWVHNFQIHTFTTYMDNWFYRYKIAMLTTMVWCDRSLEKLQYCRLLYTNNTKLN